MTLKRSAIVLSHHWLFIAVLTALLVAAVGVFSFRAAPSYEATALLQVQAAVDNTGAISLQDTLTARERAVTIVDLGNTGEVSRRAQQTLGTVRAHYSCSFAQVGQSEFLKATCDSTRKADVARLANGYGLALQTLLEDQRQARVAELNRVYSAQIRELRAQGVPPQNFPIQPILPSYRELELIDGAVTPSAPYAPRPIRNMAIALVLGLVLNSLLAFGLEHIQNRPHDTDEVQRALKEPVLVSIPPLRAALQHVVPDRPPLSKARLSDGAARSRRTA